MEKFGNDRKTFMALVSALCVALSYPARDDEIRDDETLVMEMTLEGIEFTVSHSFNSDPEKIIVQGVFGHLPAENTTEVLYRLMHLNRELSESGVASIGYDQNTENVVYSHEANLNTLSGDGLLAVMTEIAWRAAYWQSSYFLQAEPAELTGKLDQKFISLA